MELYGKKDFFGRPKKGEGIATLTRRGEERRGRK